MPTDTVLLVDGGGTKTRAVLVAPDDRRLAEGLAGPSNLMIGAGQARQAVRTACERAMAKGGAPGQAEPTMYCAMAGGGNSQLCQEFSAIPPAPAVLVTDAYASMVGALGGQPGIGIVVGTGTAAYSLDGDGQVRECGGWGLAIGDEGSGAWIGRAALSVSVKIADGQHDRLLDRTSPDDNIAFAKGLFKTVGMNRTDLLEWVRVAAPADFASLTPGIVALAGAGNQTAINLLHRAGECLEQLWLALDPRMELPVSIVGGLAPHLSAYLPRRLEEAVCPAAGDVIDGLLRIARGQVQPVELSDKPLIQ